MIMRTRKQLRDAMIQLYGMESDIVVEFCNLCVWLEENEWNERVLNLLVEAHEANPLTAEQLEALE